MILLQTPFLSLVHNFLICAITMAGIVLPNSYVQVYPPGLQGITLLGNSVVSVISYKGIKK